MKLSELQVGKTYAVIPTWTAINTAYVHYKDINNIGRRDVTKVTVVSLDKYVYEEDSRYCWSEDVSKFKTAPKNSKTSLGLLVQTSPENDNAGRTSFGVVRLSEIVADWDVLEPLWLAKEEQQRQEQLKEKLRQEEIQRKRDNARLHAERAQVNLPNTLKKLLNGTLYGNVSLDYNSYSDNPNATVTLSLRDMERLIELVYDTNEEVA